MGRFCAIVVTRGGTDTEIAVALAPWGECGDDAKWKTWRLGGCWSGELILKPGGSGRHGDGSVYDALGGLLFVGHPDIRATMGCDAARKRDIADFGQISGEPPIIFDGLWLEPADDPDADVTIADRLAMAPDDMFVAVVDCKT